MFAAFVAAIRSHPILSAIFTIAVLGGIAAGIVWLPADWHIARRAAAGALSGAGCALLMTAHRLYG